MALLKSFEDTVRICSQIANSGSTSNKDRIEARKAVDLANAHIFRLVNEGTMFHHLPEVSKYVKLVSKDDTDTSANQVLPSYTTDTDTYNTNDIDIEDKDNINNNNNNINLNNNLIKNQSSSQLDSTDSNNNERDNE